MEEAFKINQNRNLNQKSSKVRNDSAVQGTNDSSVLSKISAAELGYVEDDYLKYFANKLARRSPLVNRGYYIRAKLIDFAVREFLDKVNKDELKNQMVNLGAGFDSTYFRLKALNLLNRTLFIEVDFPDVISRKINLIKSNSVLNSLCPDLEKVKDINGNLVYQSLASNYVAIGMDLRNTKLLEAILKTVDGFHDSYPTFLLSEVVLTYMAVNSCNGVLKWISETFPSSVLTIYEQINPFDGFGQVMCSHFKKLGSALKCILRYPSELDQINRHKQLGFTNSYALRASEFYKHNIGDDEKQRIEQLELFDEYEAWHLKCTHYSLFSATRGDYCDALVRESRRERLDELSKARLVDEASRFSGNLETVRIRPFGLKFGARFGHSLCALNSSSGKRLLCVLGGFGELATDLNGKHLRLSAIEICDLDGMSLHVVDAKPTQIGDRIFFTCNVINDENNSESILICFGRSNPSKIFDSIVRVKGLISESGTTAKDENELICETITPKSDSSQPLSRFRHVSCTIPSSSSIFVHGGKYFEESSSTSSPPLSDAYLIDHLTGRVRNIPVDKEVFPARHSHSVCTWKNQIILTGGVDINERVLDDIVFVDSETFEFKKVEIRSGHVLPRYSHTSHIIDDNYLVLVGGANYYEIPPGICIIDLVNLKAFEFRLPFQLDDQNPLIAVCHQTHVIDKNTLLLVGGGAVCFTFGTHLNKQPIVIDISNCWTQIQQS